MCSKLLKVHIRNDMRNREWKHQGSKDQNTSAVTERSGKRKKLTSASGKVLAARR